MRFTVYRVERYLNPKHQLRLCPTTGRLDDRRRLGLQPDGDVLLLPELSKAGSGLSSFFFSRLRV